MTAIKLILVVAVLAMLPLLLRYHGTSRGGAFVKMAMGLFLGFALYAVLRPEDVTWLAMHLGVGRGTDLVLYLLVVGFGFFSISTYLRFKEVELRFARLVRVVALAEADRREGEPGPDEVGQRISPDSDGSARP